MNTVKLAQESNISHKNLLRRLRTLLSRNPDLENDVEEKWYKEAHHKKFYRYYEISEVVVDLLTKSQQIKTNRREHNLRDLIANELNGRTEVQTAVGFIDILTDSEIIEVKSFLKWKEAVGQVILFDLALPDNKKRTKVIVLFGDDRNNSYDIASRYCSKLGIKVRRA